MGYVSKTLPMTNGRRKKTAQVHVTRAMVCWSSHSIGHDKQDDATMLPISRLVVDMCGKSGSSRRGKRNDQLSAMTDLPCAARLRGSKRTNGCQWFMGGPEDSRLYGSRSDIALPLAV